MLMILSAVIIYLEHPKNFNAFIKCREVRLKMKSVAKKDRILFNDYRVFEVDNNRFVFSIPDNKIFEIDNKVEKLISLSGETFDSISHKMSSDYSEEELFKILETMGQAGFLNNSEVEKYTVKELKILTLLLVQGCNLRCSYCYAEDGKYNDSGEMSKETAFKAVDFLLNKTKLKDIGICFFGGEPLLQFGLIKDIVAYCKMKEKEEGREFHFSMTTNGTLITEDIEKFIIENKISTQISIDGDENTHNKHRFFANKEGTHDFVMKKTKTLREGKKLLARATITKESIENVENNYMYLLDSGFRNIAMSATYDMLDSEDFRKLTNAFISMYKHCEDLIKKEEYSKVKNNKMFMQELGRIHKASRCNIACGVGRYTYAIDVHGDIYPCQRFVSNKEFCIGNVYENDNKREDFLEEIAFDKHKECQKCWARNLCKGGCAHVNLSMTGKVNEPDPEYCNFIRSINECLVEIYLRLSQNEIEQLWR